jgi:hypothetical protein
MTDYAELSAPELLSQAMASDDGAMIAAALARIDAHAAAVKRTLDAGATPDEFKILTQVHDALALSKKTSATAWTVQKKLREREGA